MTQFHNQDFAQRYGTMGDTAEAVYETWADENNIKWDRFGHNRPRANMFKWPAFIRYTPDYITHDRLVEVKGCGRDGLLKIKVENVDAMMEWGDHLPIYLFVWNSSQQLHAYFQATLEWERWLYETCSIGRFPDNDKRFFNIPFDQCKEGTWKMS